MATVLPFYSHSRGPHRSFSNFYTPAKFILNTANLLAPLDLTSEQKAEIIATHGNVLHMKFSEQAFMIGKAFAFYYADHRNAAVVDKMINATTPAEVKKLGGRGSLQGFDDKVWHPVREQIMYIACLEKFRQNPDLEQILLSTGDQHLVEAAPKDRIWGVGMGINHPDIMNPKKWKGLNLLGETLKRVRDTLRKPQPVKLKVAVRPVKLKVAVRPVKPVKKKAGQAKPQGKPDYELEGAPIYKSNSYIFSDPSAAAQSLRDNGVVVIPCFSATETAKIFKSMEQEIHEFPEYYGDITARLDYETTDPVTNAYRITATHGKKKTVYEGRASKDTQLEQVEKACVRYSEQPTIGVLGSFQALGNPASFHTPTVRHVRRQCYEPAHDMFQQLVKAKGFKGKWYLEQNFDRVGYRVKGTKIPADADSWHRDVMPDRHLEPGDEILGGWINLNSTNETFVCVPGTHLRPPSDGFVKCPAPDFAMAVQIPPGHTIIFYQHILHAIAPKKFAVNSIRQFLSWRLTQSNVSLRHPEKDIVMDTQSVPKAPSDMIFGLASANHRSALLWKMTMAWTLATLKPEYIEQKVTKQGNGIYYLPQHPVQPQGRHYSDYSDGDRAIMLPQALN